MENTRVLFVVFKKRVAQGKLIRLNINYTVDWEDTSGFGGTVLNYTITNEEVFLQGFT